MAVLTREDEQQIVLEVASTVGTQEFEKHQRINFVVLVSTRSYQFVKDVGKARFKGTVYNFGAVKSAAEVREKLTKALA